ncbi:Uncharacterised protein [Xylophilus ampelinus]|nr:Uncharacterised protein [Xylophilus ampelinus]
MTYSSASQVVRQILEGPVTRPALLRWRRRQFFSEAGFAGYFGVFRDFSEARHWLPENPEFDHAALAAEDVNIRTKKIFAYDYPVMWWLERAFRDGATKVLDIGGSVGVHFYAYRRLFFEMPQALSWHVVEVPAIASIGRKVVRQAQVDALSFTHTDALGQALAGNDIWPSAGALHYVDYARPADLLKQCGSRPRHILLNKLPLYDGEDYVTAQNIGAGCFAPINLYNRQRLISEVEALGYALCDEWQVPERSLYLPGFPELCISAHSGLYFRTLNGVNQSVDARPSRSWGIRLHIVRRRYGEDETSHHRHGASCRRRDSWCGDLRRPDGLRRSLQAASRFPGWLADGRDCRDRPGERDSAQRSHGLQEEGQPRGACTASLRHPDRSFHGATPRAHRDAESGDIRRVGRHRFDQRRQVRRAHSRLIAQARRG